MPTVLHGTVCYILLRNFAPYDHYLKWLYKVTFLKPSEIIDNITPASQNILWDNMKV